MAEDRRNLLRPQRRASVSSIRRLARPGSRPASQSSLTPYYSVRSPGLTSPGATRPGVEGIEAPLQSARSSTTASSLNSNWSARSRPVQISERPSPNGSRRSTPRARQRYAHLAPVSDAIGAYGTADPGPSPGLDLLSPGPEVDTSPLWTAPGVHNLNSALIGHSASPYAYSPLDRPPTPTPSSGGQRSPGSRVLVLAATRKGDGGSSLWSEWRFPLRLFCWSLSVVVALTVAVLGLTWGIWTLRCRNPPYRSSEAWTLAPETVHHLSLANAKGSVRIDSSTDSPNITLSVAHYSVSRRGLSDMHTHFELVNTVLTIAVETQTDFFFTCPRSEVRLSLPEDWASTWFGDDVTVSVTGGSTDVTLNDLGAIPVTLVDVSTGTGDVSVHGLDMFEGVFASDDGAISLSNIRAHVTHAFVGVGSILVSDLTNLPTNSSAGLVKAHINSGSVGVSSIRSGAIDAVIHEDGDLTLSLNPRRFYGSFELSTQAGLLSLAGSHIETTEQTPSYAKGWIHRPRSGGCRDHSPAKASYTLDAFTRRGNLDLTVSPEI